jgi:hypothetical protein
MEYYFDIYGWLSNEPIEGRSTEIVPPEHGDKVDGSEYPNFTGYGWLMLMYPNPIQPPSPPLPPPVLISILTPLEFLNRFTDTEAKTIIGLSKTDPDVELWWLKYNKAQDIDLDDPQTIEGVQSLEAIGVISVGRAAEILTKYPV